MKKVTFLLFGMIYLKASIAQIDPIVSYNRYVVENWAGQYIRIGPYMVKGSPFFFGESLSGSLLYKGGRKMTEAKILYDVYNQKAGIDKNNDIFESEEPLEEFVVSVPEKYGKGKLLFRNSYVYGKPEMKTFFNVLEDGDKLVFLKQFKSKLMPDPVNSMDKDRKIFEQYNEFYMYSKATKELHKVKLREKDIMKEIGNDTQVKTYLSSKEVDFSKENEVISLLNKFNNNFAALQGN